MKVNRLKFEEDGVVVTIDEKDTSIRDMLKIDVNNLVDELRDQASLFSYWAVLCTQATSALRDAERNLNQFVNSETVQIKKEYDARGEQMTEYLLLAIVRSRDEFLQLRRVVLARKEEFEVLDSIRASLWQRKNMLESITTVYRTEYYANPKT